MSLYNIGIHEVTLKKGLTLDEAEQLLMVLKDAGIVGAYMDEIDNMIDDSALYDDEGKLIPL